MQCLTLVAMLLLNALTLASASGSAQAAWHSDSRALMGTLVSVRLWHDDPALGRAAANAVFAEVERIEALMSTYRTTSRISAVNREAAQHPVVAGAELFGLIARAVELSRLSTGAFDITYDSVGKHYDFRGRQRPNRDIIETELARIDYRLLELDAEQQSVRFRRAGVRINLGGIAKGYAVERAAVLLRGRGVRHALVTAGGDSRLVGDRRGKPWQVGVRDPRDAEAVAVRLPLADEAISTSGDYERFFEEDGVRYHHIIHPDTGEPAAGVHSVTIVGPDAVMTDGLSTAVFILGIDKGLRLVGALPGYEGIVIDAAGQLYYSDGLQPPAGSQ